MDGLSGTETARVDIAVDGSGGRFEEDVLLWCRLQRVVSKFDADSRCSMRDRLDRI
jgi:hypothetical protein